MVASPLRLLLVLAYALAVGACTEMIVEPKTSELDWIPSDISLSGCPNLSGEYIIRDDEVRYGSIEWIMFSPKSLYDSSVPYSERKYPVRVTVRSHKNGFYVKLDNKKRSVENEIHFDGARIGCNNGVVVYRYIHDLRTPGEVGGCTRLSYGETRLYLSDNNDLHFVRSYRNRCSKFGSLLNQPPNIGKDVTIVFKRMSVPVNNEK